MIPVSVVVDLVLVLRWTPPQADNIEKYLYVNSELESRLLVYDTTSLSLLSSTDLTPPTLPPSIRPLLLTAELYAHPTYTRTLYISLRGTQRLDLMATPRGDPDLPPPPVGDIDRTKREHEGDSIAIVYLSDDASNVQEVRHHETTLDWIRGMRISDDGLYLAAAGEFGGGLEIYKISGDRGGELELVAKDQSVKDVNCVLWL